MNTRAKIGRVKTPFKPIDSKEIQVHTYKSAHQHKESISSSGAGSLALKQENKKNDCKTEQLEQMLLQEDEDMSLLTNPDF